MLKFFPNSIIVPNSCLITFIKLLFINNIIYNLFCVHQIRGINRRQDIYKTNTTTILSTYIELIEISQYITK